ncbi:hypothetical protein HALA3H3_330029 [Halomonas sp. A3H3]|uniref:hypothetical protein n=1 Tax=Halomonas sp. A3H3 TaxID=1346287 RepID=UPI00038D82AE|nr:hypothetical protein [Halomonas sp. A3H3]CDG52297.1 hypothetical protein HALA3H3_330029 [Halomonas sp. A3H3]
MKKLKGSVGHYEQPFEPVGLSDWETVLLEDLTPENAHEDVLATPTLKELGEDTGNKQ